MRCGRDGLTGGGGLYGMGGETDFYSLKVKSDGGYAQTYIGSPSATFLMGDANYMDLEPLHCFKYDVSGHREFGLMYRHGYGQFTNLVYFDGHAESQVRFVPFNGLPGTGTMGNLMPLEEPW